MNNFSTVSCGRALRKRLIYLTPGLVIEGEHWFSIIRNDVNAYQTMKEHLFTTVKVLAVALESTARATEIKVYVRIMRVLHCNYYSADEYSYTSQ